MHNPEFFPKKWDAKTSLGFWDTNGSPNLGQMTSSNDSQQKKKETCQIVDFAVLADHRVKLKEAEMRDKYLNLARKLKELWDIKMMVIPIVVGTFGIISKGLVKGQ